MQRQLTQTGAASPAGSGSSPILDGGSSGGGKSGSPPDKTTSRKPEGEGGDSGKPSTGLWKLYLDALASQPVSKLKRQGQACESESWIGSM